MKANIGFYKWQNVRYRATPALFGRFWQNVRNAKDWRAFHQRKRKFPRIIRVKKSYRYL